MAATPTMTRSVPDVEHRPATGSKAERIARFLLGAAATVMLLLAVRLPVWEARLEVLQYPGRPLVLTAYGSRLEGDVDEIRILNHYVGLRVFDMGELPETVLWIPTIAAALAGVAVATAIPRRMPGGPKPRRSWLGISARALLWAIPLAILVDIQFRLYELGHSMDPSAPFDQEPFTPWVIGVTKVASNVTTTAWPGSSVLTLLATAFLMTFGMSLFRFGEQLAGIGGVDEARRGEG